MKQQMTDDERLAHMDPQSKELLLAFRRRQGLPFVGKRPIIRKVNEEALQKDEDDHG